MNIKKLLTTTAIVAMMSTSASAAITVTQADVVAGANVATQTTLASELDLAAASLVGTSFEFSVDFVNTGGDDVNDFSLLVTLPAGVTLGANILTPATNIVHNGDAVLGGAGIGDDLDGTAGDVALLNGGAAGGSSVEFSVNLLTSTTTLDLVLPLNVGDGACAGSAITVNLTRRSTGAAVDGGTASLTAAGLPSGIVKCVSAVDVSSAGLGVVSDAATNDSITTIASGFTAFDATVAGDTATQATLGTVKAALVAADIDLAGTAFGTGGAGTSGDVTNVDFSVSFADVTGIDSVDLALFGGNTLSVTTPTGNDFVFSVTADADIDSLFDANADDILVNIGGGTAPLPVIAVQSVSVTGSTISFDTTANLIASEAFASGSLDGIEKEGISFGPFDWVGDASKASRNIFRMTGAPSDAVAGEATFTNSSTGNNGTFPFTFNSLNGEGQMDSIALDALNPGFGRADVSFIFFDAGPTDVDRLMLRGDVLSTFGGDANGANGNVVGASSD